MESFKKIFNRFDQFVKVENTKVTQRVRLLIKNLFTERESGWENTRSQHEKGLKTKSQVQKEVEEKALKDQQAREASYRGGGDRRDKYGGGRDSYNDGGRRNNDRDRKGHQR